MHGYALSVYIGVIKKFLMEVSMASGIKRIGSFQLYGAN